MPKKVTLSDVAKAADVSRATASLVLRKSPLVADHTRQKVERVMTEMDYVRDIGAARLRDNSSRTIGLIVPNLVNSFFTEFLSGVELVMGKEDYVVLLANSLDDPKQQENILQRFRGHGVDGVILCPAEGTEPELLKRMQTWGLPTVQSLREVGHGVTDYAGADYVAAVQLAVRYLVGKGHRNIAFLSVHARTSAREERLKGFDLALAELDANSAGIVEAELSWEGAEGAAHSILALEPRPTAVLCFNDVLAAGLMMGLRRAGLNPGQDIAVVGLDDLQLAQLTYPTLSSVATSPHQIGNLAARLLSRRLLDKDAPCERAIIEPRLVDRDSS